MTSESWNNAFDVMRHCITNVFEGRSEVHLSKSKRKRIRIVLHAKKKETKMAPTAQQLSSQWMTEAEKETETDKLVRKSKQSPFIPIGELN